jgi:hypothetical protein
MVTRILNATDHSKKTCVCLSSKKSHTLSHSLTHSPPTKHKKLIQTSPASASNNDNILSSSSMAVTSTSLASQLSIGLRRHPSPKLDYLTPTSSFFDSNLRLSVSSAKPSRTVIAMAGSGKVFLPLPLFLSILFSLQIYCTLISNQNQFWN